MTAATSNIVLTGFMGTGKTTVGRLIAARLGFEFVDTDRVIEERHGPIAAIFAEEGELRFRDLEREVAKELAARDSLVVATGGRLLLDSANAAALGATGRIFCLVASVDTIVARIADGRGPVRPLLAEGGDLRERVAALLAARADGYAKFSQIDTDGRSPGEVCDLLLAALAADRD